MTEITKLTCHKNMDFNHRIHCGNECTRYIRLRVPKVYQQIRCQKLGEKIFPLFFFDLESKIKNTVTLKINISCIFIIGESTNVLQYPEYQQFRLCKFKYPTGKCINVLQYSE